MGFSRQEYWSGVPLPSPSQVALVVKNRPANAGDAREMVSVPGSEMIPWRRKWQPAPVFLSGKFHGQRNLAGYSPWGHKMVGYDLVTKKTAFHVLGTMLGASHACFHLILRLSF